MTAYKLTVDKMTVDNMTTDEMTVDKITRCQANMKKTEKTHFN